MARKALTIDNDTGDVIAATPRSKAKPKKQLTKRQQRAHRAQMELKALPVEPTIIADVALALGIAEAIFETADYIADIFERRG